MLLALQAWSNDTKKPKINDALRYYELKGAVDTMRELKCSVVEKLGGIGSGKCEKGRVFHFDKDGRELEWTLFIKKNMAQKYKAKYSESGLYLGANMYDGEGTLTDKTIATLSPNGYIEKININDHPSGELFRVIYFEFDSEGNRLSITRSNPDNTVISVTKYTYNAKNLKLTEKWYAKDEKLERALVFKYDDKGNLIEQTETNYKEKEKITKSTYKYIFDNNGNWIEKVEYQSNKPKAIWKREIKYY